MTTTPLISVVIPAHNAADTLEPLLRQLTSQSLPHSDYEIIVVDDGSTDTTPDMLQRFPEVKIIRQDNSGPGAARNVGTDAATADRVLYLDADLGVAPDLLETHLRHHQAHPDIAASGGSVLPYTDYPALSWAMADHLCSWFNAHPESNRDGDIEYLPSLNFCINRRRVVEDYEIRWDAGLEHTGEDVLYCHALRQAGLRLAFVSDAQVYHKDRDTARAYLTHMHRWGLHAPHVRGRLRDLAYSFLFPARPLKLLLTLPLIVFGYSFLIWRSWLTVTPLQVSLALPQILIGRVAYAYGVLLSTRAMYKAGRSDA